MDYNPLALKVFILNQKYTDLFFHNFYLKSFLNTIKHNFYKVNFYD